MARRSPAIVAHARGGNRAAASGYPFGGHGIVMASRALLTLLVLSAFLVVPLASADVTVWGCARTDCSHEEANVPAPVDCNVYVPITVGGGVHAISADCLRS